ncbi:MAG TPA: low molecular weight protein-tyrosine-phosphatase [Chitinophagales bacterium]|nr:low molecular weight protein-tyrosine-phosphatase [Chitinophagales bacterium]HLP49686.1 low molecular weight protein-tyrosine-phosphatase [Chitinophagales bacterium]
MKILMVCLGNICRSPIAHGLLQHKVEKLGLDWEIDSAGTSDWHKGELPNENSIKVMGRYGIDINYQRSRPIERKDLEYYDVIYVMDASNHETVVTMAKSEAEIAKVLYIMNEVEPGKNQKVPDPWSLTEQHYEDVYLMLDKATDKIIEKYNKK